MRAGAVNCKEHEPTCDYHQVKVYPTLKLFWGVDEDKYPFQKVLESRTPPLLAAEVEKRLQCTFAERRAGDLRGTQLIPNNALSQSFTGVQRAPSRPATTAPAQEQTC